MMRLPSHQECQAAIKDMATFLDQLTEWEREFVTSNLERINFTPLQREQIARLSRKYDLGIH